MAAAARGRALAGRLWCRLPARDWPGPAAPRRAAPPRAGPGGAGAVAGRRAYAAGGGAGTQLGAYLQRCGAVWDEAPKADQVAVSDSGRAFSWNLELPPERLESMREGEMLESPPFSIGQNCRARFHLYPKGDGECATRDSVSVQQSLHLTGLEVADWQVFNIQELLASGSLVTSPPFRFHHVLLGDMYLELRPGIPHPGHCAVFFRCRVPTMQLRVNLAVGDAFSKSFVALGRSTHDADVASGSCLGVNLHAPGVLRPDGSLAVRCALEEVVNIPAAMRDLIPKLDERAQWPKRL